MENVGVKKDCRADDEPLKNFMDNWGIRKDGKGDEVNDEHAKGLNVKQMHPYSSLFSPTIWHPPH